MFKYLVSYKVGDRQEQCLVGDKELDNFISFLKSPMPLYYKGEHIGDMHDNISDIKVEEYSEVV